MSIERDVDVAVIGGGVVGAAAACLLAGQNRQVVLLDRQRPEQWAADQPRDMRVFAIAPGSVRILQACQAWEAIQQARVSPYQSMQVTSTSGGLVSFHAHQHGLPQLGWIIENRLLQSKLWEQLEQCVELAAPAEITRLIPGQRHTVIELNDGGRLRARLLVAADGARSWVRQQLDIAIHSRDYQQQALVAELDTQIPNQGVAWQIFLPSGPLAFLPLGEGRSSMVWSLPAEQAEQVKQWDRQRLGAELTLISNGRFGQVQPATPVLGFPLRLQLAERMLAQRVVLLGDAAHQVHPLAGQGVNMGLQDAAALAEQLAQVDWQDSAAIDLALGKFERWRISENALLSRGIDGIQRLFTRQPVMAGLGLSLVDRLWPLKDRFMQRACGIHGNAPAVCRQ